MAEWVTHVLVAYAVFTGVGWYIEWVDGRWVAVALVGSVLPDFDRLGLLVDDDWVTATTGVPFDWGGVHSLGGLVCLAGVGALLFGARREQVRAYLLLLGGGLLHVALDVPQAYADGRALTNNYLFPVTSWRPTTPGLYVSADRWVVIAAAALAGLVFVADRYRQRDGESG